MPKLLLYAANDPSARYYDQAADPKQKANLAAGDVLPVLKSFLAKYLPRGQALISLPNH
jgi:hypothetical protein